MSRLGTICRALLIGFTDIPSWGGLWILLVLLAILGFRAFRQSQAIALWGLFIGHLGLYVLIYMITPWELSDLLPITLPRLMMHLAPTAMLLIALHWKALLPVAQTPAEPV